MVRLIGANSPQWRLKDLTALLQREPSHLSETREHKVQIAKTGRLAREATWTCARKGSLVTVRAAVVLLMTVIENGWSFFWRLLFFFRARFFFGGGWLVLARTVPLLQAVAGNSV